MNVIGWAIVAIAISAGVSAVAGIVTTEVRGQADRTAALILLGLIYNLYASADMTRSERRQEVLTYLGRMTEEGFNRLQADERERLIRAVREAADTEPPTAHASDPYPVT